MLGWKEVDIFGPDVTSCYECSFKDSSANNSTYINGFLLSIVFLVKLKHLKACAIYGIVFYHFMFSIMDI